MMHPAAMVTGVFDHEVDGHKGPLACALFSHQFYETDTGRGFARGYGFQVVRTFGPVANALGGVGGHERLPWGQDHRPAFSELFNRCITVAVIADDLPEPSNRVELDPELTDNDGIPAPRVVYKTSENSRKMLDHGIARAEELMEAAGARRTMVTPQVTAGGWHLLGTARMGDDPRSSVVNAQGRSHDVPNLYVVDGSIFVTGGAVNPTSTIQALALHVADAFERSAGK